MSKTTSSLFLILFLLIIASSFTFDLSQTDKHQNVLSKAPCNKDTVIDFAFDPNTVISSCSSTGCTLASPNLSTLRFLDVIGEEKTYTLQSATVSSTPGGVSRAQEAGIFEFTFQSQGKSVIVAVPFSNTLSSSVQPQTYQLNLDRNSDPSLALLSLTGIQINNSTGIPLSAFNYLNGRDYGNFYHVTDTSKTITYLLSYFILANIDIPLKNLPALPAPFPSLPVDYQATGDKLCYGSVSEGVFQTHIRESYPLWTAWIGIFIFWLYYMFTDLFTISCYDRRFQNNKWTCWAFYSLHHLSHDQYFTKLSRQTLLLVSFSWQGLICAVLYSQIPYGQDSIMILWAGVIAFLTALPFSYVLGYFFLNKIYKKNMHKFDVMKEMHGLFNKKEGLDKFQKQMDDIEESLYGLYYWYYVIAFVFFVVFWIISVHQMMQVPRNFYYLHRYWLASLGVAFGLEYLIYDPLMSLIFGNFRFYQIRGFYYDYRLGEKFKELEE